ncbi:PQQ-binding-like beta-propeller repeat protein [Halobaculum sp. MBLA0143]|uniref:outer membrane protein assembly factor BamB family protein n=1 Tax=Halobaculum sp. MBLA0143 TaxID=3079933 RepID=UPI0035241C36
MDTPTKRDVLRTFGSGLVAAVAGCGGRRSTETPSRTVTQSPTRTKVTPAATETPDEAAPPTETETLTETPRPIPRVAWRHATGDDIQSSPAFADKTVFVGSRAETVSALDTADGTVRWTVETAAPVVGGATVVDGTVYIGTEEGVYAIAAADGSVEWDTRRVGYIRSRPTVEGNTVYVGSRDRYVYALDAESGTVSWESEVGVTQHSQILCSPAVADGTVVVGTGDRNAVAVDAETGEELWRSSVAGRVYADPLIDRDVVYIGDSRGLVGFDLYSGDRVSRVETDRRVEGLTRGPDGLYLGGARGDIGGSVVAVSSDGRRVRWKQTLGQSVGCASSVADGTVYVGTTDRNNRGPPGRAFALDTESGAPDWRVTLDAGVRTDPAVTPEAIVVGTEAGDVIALDRSV